MPYVGRVPSAVPVTADDIPDNSIHASKIIDGSIELAEIADNSITDAKLNSSKLDGIEAGATNYTHPTTHATADIADNAITDAKLNSAKLNGIEAGATADQSKADIDALAVNAGTLDGVTTTGSEFRFKAQKLTGIGIGSSYDYRVILLIPISLLNSSYDNKIVGRITASKKGGNVWDSFDISAQSVWNDTTASFTSTGQRNTHKFVTCTYNSVKWLAIEPTFTANPYNNFWFHGQHYAQLDINGDALTVISYKDSNLGVTNSEINNSIANYTANGAVYINGSGLKVNGSISAAAFNVSSDYRLKENVLAMTGSIQRLKQLNPVNFNFIDTDNMPYGGVTVDGFLAHEVQEVIPEAVVGTKDGMEVEHYEITPAVMDGETVVTEAVMGTRSVPDYQGIDQSKLVPLLVASLQEAVDKIEALEARVTALEKPTI
jgi:hypothetical protein